MKARIIRGRTKRVLGGCDHTWSVDNSRNMLHRYCIRCGYAVYYPSGTDISFYRKIAEPKNRLIRGRSKRLPELITQPKTEPPNRTISAHGLHTLGVDPGREPSFNDILGPQVAEVDFAAVGRHVMEQVYRAFTIPREQLTDTRDNHNEGSVTGRWSSRGPSRVGRRLASSPTGNLSPEQGPPMSPLTNSLPLLRHEDGTLDDMSFVNSQRGATCGNCTHYRPAAGWGVRLCSLHSRLVVPDMTCVDHTQSL